MRILLALDGSAGAMTARSLVAGHAWPEGTVVEAVRVVEPIVDAIAGPGFVVDLPAEEILDVASFRTLLDEEVEPLRAAGLVVQPHVEIGRPASILLERAHAGHADLIVVGSRGRGPIATMLLGSVSAEVATHAPCPVLVARGTSLRRVMLALDGSPEAARVLEEALRSPLLAGAHVSVVSVAPSRIPSAGVMFAGGYGVPIGWYEESVASVRATLESAAQEGAARFAAAGIDASWSVLEGDPAATLIEAAERGSMDLVVVGTHGRTGLVRLVLGSVARNVLLHAHASVLVLHAPAAGGDPAEESAARGSAD
jgi:nucleotide-binding universal stress UspA family protein